MDVVTFSGVEAAVSFTYLHACEHKDYTSVLFMPTEFASDFTEATTCPADGLTMFIVSAVLGERSPA